MRSLAIALTIAAAAFEVGAQAAPNTTLAQIGYSALKNRVKPTGELGAQIAALDSAIRTAQLSGQTALVRRWIAKGTALMNGRQWADTSDYRQSLVLRTEHLFVDPAQPYGVRLEQTYAPSIEGLANLTATATIRSAAQATTPRRTLATTTDVARDLRDTPLRMDLDLTGAPDGDYLVEVTVSDSARELGVARLRISVLSKLSERLKALETKAAAAPADLRADIRYPGDYVRKIDRGIIAPGQFDIATELAAAESAASSSHQSPVTRRGGFERHYLLEGPNEIMPYRVFVPSKYDAKKPMPLIIALHGAGGTEDGFMDNYERRLPQLAEERGYLVATPLGFRTDGGYGSPILGGRAGANSEADVMQVLARMRADYNVDPKRIYLMGHSMGGIGTWHLGAKYPDIWAALGSFAGMGFPATVSRMKSIPQFVVHGDNDNTVNVQRSRDMVAEFQKQGMDFKYIEVPTGTHNDVVAPNIAALFDFFDTKKKP
jgi:predicted esterase